MTLQELRTLQTDLVAAEVASGKPLFLRLPDYWYEQAHWRCTRGHVSRWYIKSEEHGDMCPACYSPVLLTFPGDVDDPLIEP